MKQIRKMIGISACVLAVLTVAWLLSEPIYGKLVLGGARALTKQIPIVLEVADHKIKGARCFAEPSLYHGGQSERLILHVDDPHAWLGRHILIVDLAHQEVSLPNSSTRDYKLLLGRWLLQAESGAWGVPFGDPKLDGRDPDFQRSGNLISFTIYPELGLPSGRWNVRIDANGRI